MRHSLPLLACFLVAGCGVSPPSDRVLVTPVTFPAGPATGSGVLFAPAAPGPRPALIVVHEDYGLNAWVKEAAADLASQGYAVLAIDLFDGKVFTDLMDAHIMESRLDSKQVVGQVQGGIGFLAAQPNVDPQRIGILGWGSGGGYALEAAIADPRLRAVVVCYGRVPTEAKTLATLEGAVLGIFAGKDLGITQETLDQFTAAMGKAGKRLGGLHLYDDMPHGFLNPAVLPEPTAKQKTASDDARAQIRKFLAQELRP